MHMHNHTWQTCEIILVILQAITTRIAGDGEGVGFQTETLQEWVCFLKGKKKFGKNGFLSFFLLNHGPRYKEENLWQDKNQEVRYVFFVWGELSKRNSYGVKGLEVNYYKDLRFNPPLLSIFTWLTIFFTCLIDGQNCEF